MTKHLKIISYSNESDWHCNYVGQAFSKYDRHNDIPCYSVYSAFDGCDHFVPIEDAEEIEVGEKESDTMSKVPGGDPAYLQLLEDMRQLHIKKNAGYSGDSVDRWANFRLSETFGISSFLGVMVRMSDKWIRITNLIKNPSFDQVGESIDDTLFDLAAYALIAICIRREKKEK